MKKDQVLAHVKKVVDELTISEESKHSSINCQMVVVYKVKNKLAKFMQNFVVEIKNSYDSSDSLLLFSSEKKLEELQNTFGEDKVLKGKKFEPKKMKKVMKWALVEKDTPIEKWKSILNKKSLLPNNIEDLENVEIEEQVKKVLSGNFIKLTQMNNFFSCKVGDMRKNSHNEIIENIENIYDFLTVKNCFLVRSIYINKNMEKSQKICLRL